jgi:hypothetical protein
MMRRRTIGAAGMAVALVGVWLAVNSLATTTGPIEWTSPSPIVPSSLLASSGTEYTPAALSCRGVSLCVAVTEGGHALASATPTVPDQTWNIKLVDASHGLTAVACPSTSLCVATDIVGDVLTSEDPAAATPSWSTSAIDESRRITALSCPSEELCVAADVDGRILVSEEPTGGSHAWRASLVDGANAPILGLSCPSSSLCVATDDYGDVLTSDEPGGGPSAWSIAHIDGQHPLNGGVSCPSELFCATTDSAGNLVASSNPLGGPSAWNVVPSPSGQQLGLISCPTAALCVTTESEGRVAVTSDPTAATPTWAAATIDETEALFRVLTCNVQLTCVYLDGFDNETIGSDLAPIEPLGVSLAGNGHGTVLAQGITCPPSCGATYPTGSTVVLTATPTTGSSFAGWTGGCSGLGRCTLVMDSPRTVTATFTANGVAPHVSLSVSLGGLGNGHVTGPGIVCPPTCWTAVIPKAAVRLSATALHGSSFAGWGGAARACRLSGSCAITVTGTEGVKATFTTGHPPPLRITRVTVERARHAARIDFSTHSPVVRVVCILVRAAGPRRHSIRHDGHCRTPVTYTHLRPGAYTLTLEAFQGTRSTPTVTVNHRFTV